ncbi:MAG: DNA polymerase III subunit delta [Bacteroidota bacterium]
MVKTKIPSVNEIPKFLTKEKLLPIYFLFGEDDYTIDNSIEEIRKKIEPMVRSEFDKEFISINKNSNLTQILDLAYSFPFGGGKKLLILKNFEILSNKKELNKFILNPPEFTIVVCAYYGKISDTSKEPYSLLVSKKSIFEAKIEKGDDLIEWLVNKSSKVKLNIDSNTARGIIEIVGEDKSLLEMQLEKIYNYSINNSRFTFDDIKKIVSPTKQYSIFDLQESLALRDKGKSLEIAFNLIDAGVDIVFIINMLSKYLITIAQITELQRSNVNDNEGAGMLKVSWFYYVNCKRAKFFMTDERLLKASNALLNADISVKSTNMNSKTIISILISELLD